MGNNDEYTDEYTDEYNDEYLCRDFFVGFNFWSRLSFQISEFRVHWGKMIHNVHALLTFMAWIALTNRMAETCVSNTGAGRTIIEGANIHILVVTDCKNNRFQKKLSKQNARI